MQFGKKLAHRALTWRSRSLRGGAVCAINPAIKPALEALESRRLLTAAPTGIAKAFLGTVLPPAVARTTSIPASMPTATQKATRAAVAGPLLAPVIAADTGTYTGRVYVDANTSLSFTTGETLLSGITVFNDTDGDGALDGAEVSAVTTSAGVYTLALDSGVPLNLKAVVPANYFALGSSITGTTTAGTVTNDLPFFPTTFTGSNGFRLKLSGGKIQIYMNSAGTGTVGYQIAPASVLSGLTFNGASSDDNFVIDTTGGNPMPSSSTAFIAGSGADRVTVIAAAGGSTTSYTSNAVKIGTAPFGANSLIYTDVEAATFTGGAGSDIVNVGAGSIRPVFTGGGGADTLNIAGGTYTVPADFGADGTAVTLNASAGLAMSFATNQTFAALSLSGATTLSFTAAGKVLRTKSLSIDTANGAAIDLGASSMILDYSGAATPLAAVTGWLGSGYAGGAWTGAGLRSSAANTQYRLGYAEASTALGLSGAATTSFLGQTVDATTVLIRYTLAGDADLNGNVGITDFNAFAIRFGKSAGSTWATGDFDYDAGVGIGDFNLLAINFGQTAA